MSQLHHKDRNTEAKKTDYIQQLQTKKRVGRPEAISKPDEMERILALSIQKAKEKMQSIDTSIQQKTGGDLKSSRCDEHYTSVNTVDSRDVSFRDPIRNSSLVTEVRRPSGSGWNDSGSTAVANAMKCLQDKISELEKRLEAECSERDQLNRELKRVVTVKESAELEWQNSKRMNQQLTDQKVTLEREIELMKKTLEERDKAVERLTRDLTRERASKDQAVDIKRQIDRLNDQCNEKNMQIEGFVKDLQQTQVKLKARQKELDKKNAEISELEQQLALSTKQTNRLAELLQDKSSYKQPDDELVRQLESKIDQLHRVDELNKALIGKLESELTEEKQRRSSHWMSRETEHAYIEKINNLESELQRVRSTVKMSHQSKLQKAVQENERLREDYDNTLLRLERAQAALASQEKQAKAFRRKFEDSKALLKEFVAGVNKLPSGVTSHLKFLLTRVAKLDTDPLARLDRSTSRSVDRLSRSHRMRSASKDSKSGRKKKVLKMEDLNSSRNSARSIGAMQTKPILDSGYNRSGLKSDTKSVHSRKSSKKAIPLNNSKVQQSLKDQSKNLIMYKCTQLSTDRQIGLESEINEIECKILENKKEMRRLCSRQSTNVEEEEERRCRKNELVAEMQIKLEQLAMLKRKLRKEGGTQF